MYDPVSKNIIVSRDVVFEEDKQWDWGTEETRSPILVLGNKANLQPEYENAEEEQQVEDGAIEAEQ